MSFFTKLFRSSSPVPIIPTESPPSPIILQPPIEPTIIFEDEEEGVVEEDVKDESNILPSTPLFTNDKFSVYIMDGRLLCINVPVWFSNRTSDENHIQCLERDIERDHHVIGSFKILRDKEGKLRVFDGQHRVIALQRICNRNSSFTISALCEVYNVDSFDSPEADSLFERANNVKNVSHKDLPNKVASAVVSRLSRKYPNIFVDSTKTRVNRPRINKKEMYDSLKAILEEVADDKAHGVSNSYPTTTEDILKAIDIRNTIYSTRKLKDFKGVPTTLYTKAQESGFYLGLDKDLKWLSSLSN